MVDEKVFAFKHEYFKLENNIFPTVRGKNSINDYQIGNLYPIITPYGNNRVILLDKYHRQLKELSLVFVRLDGSYHDTRKESVYIKSLDDYIDLLNSFVPVYASHRYTRDSVITVFWLAKYSWTIGIASIDEKLSNTQMINV